MVLEGFFFFLVLSVREKEKSLFTELIAFIFAHTDTRRVIVAI